MISKGPTNFGYRMETPQPYLLHWQLADELRSTYDHGAIHMTSEQIFQKEGKKSAADVFWNLFKFPWIAKCVRTFQKKLETLYPDEISENKVSKPWPKPMSSDKAASLVLWKNLSVETYRLESIQDYNFNF